MSDGTNGKNYFVHGVMAEKRWERLTLYVNFENVFDVRQSRWQPMFTGSVQSPAFAEIYAPTDGFIFNGGVKIRL